WNFNLQDANGREVARITKTFEGVAKTLFTNADNYVLTIHEPLSDPLRMLVIASAVSVDLALKQDNRGLG
ncbi:MAG: phospholipid scramblase-related protein, partial [Actinomycetota bacterium]